MRPLTPADLLDAGRYEAAREAYRAAVIAHKQARRVPVGDRVTVVFEDRETLRFQVQEMLRVERITDEAGIQRELEVYNELMPGERELSATLFIEVPDLPSIRTELDRLVGIDEHVRLRIGAGADAAVVAARFDEKQMEEDRISAVQYIRFGLSEEEARRFADPAEPVALCIDHPSYAAETPLHAATRESLAADLRDETPRLLDPSSAAPAGAPGDEVVREEPGLRVLRPSAPRLPGHLVVEVTRPDAPVAATLRSLAEGRRCRVQAELGDATERWHLFPIPGRGRS